MMKSKTMSLLSEWKVPRSWKRIPTEQEDDLDVEKKFLDDNSIDPSTRSNSEDGELRWPLKPNTIRSHKISLSFLFINLVLLITSLFVNRSFLWDKNYCIRETSYYSPLIEAMPIRQHETTTNGTVWPTSVMGWSRLEKGNPIAEEMWESFENITVFPISRKDVVKLGKDPQLVAKFEDDFWGMGDDAYIATTDATHKMHCLNELRKTAFMTYGDETPRIHKQHSQLWWLHQRHCLDMLAQDILCHADADVFTFNWMDTQRKPFPDFSINRKCRNIHDVFEYRQNHGVDMEKYLEMRRPPHAKQVPNEPGYYAMFGFDGSDLFPNGVGYTTPLPDLREWFGNLTINKGGDRTAADHDLSHHHHD